MIIFDDIGEFDIQAIKKRVDNVYFKKCRVCFSRKIPALDKILHEVTKSKEIDKKINSIDNYTKRKNYDY